jgi:hypothetical protein
MSPTEQVGPLSGRYHDVLRDPTGRVVWDHGWRSNAIVGDCRRLLAAFLRGAPASTGLVGLQIGAGRSEWDALGTPAATPAQTALVDPHPFTVPAADLQLHFLDVDTVVSRPSTRLQVHADLGPNVPDWPDGASHQLANLREFGLVAELDGEQILVNYVTHPVIAKDRDSTLQRTIWLTF